MNDNMHADDKTWPEIIRCACDFVYYTACACRKQFRHSMTQLARD
jgi:hypothetical protein